MVYCTDPTSKERQKHRLRIDARPARQYLGVSAFAELILVDANALVPMPAGLSFDAAALLSCCLTTGLAAVFNVARPDPGARIAVFGCGGVGLGAVQAARIAGAAQIIAADPQPHRRELAAQLGATDTLDPEAVDVPATITQITGGGVEHAIEAVGLSTTVVDAFRALRPGGQATVLGMLAPGDDPALPGRLLRHGRTISGTVMGSVRTRADIPRYADLILRGLLHADELATTHRPLDRIADGLAHAQARVGARTMITF
jgi:S-(hydroxymethyl)glutathione dehydrogenase/alcohol dehydrogenase